MATKKNSLFRKFTNKNKTQKKGGISRSHETSNNSIEKLLTFMEQTKADTHSKILSKISNSLQKTKSARAATKAANTIKNAFTAKLLKTVCSDAGVCMAFGQKRDTIIHFFNGFTTFEYATKRVKMIGEPSSNGFVREIRYNRLGYNSFAILKSAKRPNADNLVYEYIVGQYINKQCKRFPCFIETYGMYYYKDPKSWSKFSNPKSNITPKNLQESLELEQNPYNYSKMCLQSQYATVLTEHIKHAKSMNSFIYADLGEVTGFIMKHMAYVLYQIYMPLGVLQDNFTHYDLHSGNVLLYEPVKGKYIEYHYHTNNTVVRFKSSYISKIIDYGRCYYKFGEQDTKPENALEPLDIYETLCQERDCSVITNNKESICGSKLGFGWMEPGLKRSGVYISSSESNPSHDLRLLHIIRQALTPIYDMLVKIDNNDLSKYKYLRDTFDLLMNNILSKVKYGVGITDEKNKVFGTEPNISKGYPFAVYNVKDAEEALRNIILNPDMKFLNDAFFNDSSKKLGNMHVYSDGSPTKFIPTKPTSQ